MSKMKGISEEEMVDRAFNQLLEDYMNSNHRKRDEKIIKAFNLARSAHEGAKRKSGEPYILHPIAVAEIVCNEIGLGSTSIASALLHDVVEDTDYTVQDIRDMFGNSIAIIVDGLTKLSGEILAQMDLGQDASAQLENIRRLLLTANRDIRVILVKIADRLHNMRTLSSMPEAKQAKIAAETRLFYSHLAERLGMYDIMSELQDLSLKYDHPEEYEDISRQIEASNEKRASLFERFYSIVKPDLDATGLKYEMHYRVKSVYSIWHKMKVKQLPFNEIYDLFAIRIIFDPSSPQTEYSDCFRIYRSIAAHFSIKGDRIRDWLSTPKDNGYQALHVTVMGPTGEWIEIQIRSRRMHEMAEKGLAAHWRYKQKSDTMDEVEEKILNNVKALLSNPGPNASDDYETMMYKFSTQDMLLFTKDGARIRSTQGFTVLDFAYQLGVEIGNHCIGAKVNHEMVNIDHVLNNGDQVEILTTAKTFPKEEWLLYAQSPTAKRAIHAYLRESKARSINEGREHLENYAKEYGLTPKELLKEKGPVLSYPSKEDFYYAISKKSLRLTPDLLDELQDTLELTPEIIELDDDEKSSWDSDETQVPSIDPAHKKDIYTLSATDGKRNYIRATCCKPILGDDVHGLLNSANQVVVHKKYCPEAIKLKAMKGDDIVPVAWGTHLNSTFGITLRMEGTNHEGFVNNITDTLRSRHIPLTAISFESSKDRALGTISIRIPNTTELDLLIRKLRDDNDLLRIFREDIPR